MGSNKSVTIVVCLASYVPRSTSQVEYAKSFWGSRKYTPYSNVTLLQSYSYQGP
jgi:hypothetical protein